MSKKPASAKKHSASAKSAVSSSVPNITPLERGRLALEGMYSMHLILLLVMTVLASFSMVLVVKQQNELDSLRFRLDFMYQKYGVERDRSATYLDTKYGEVDEVEASELSPDDKLTPYP